MSNELSRVKTYQNKRRKTVENHSRQNKQQQPSEEASSSKPSTSPSTRLRRGKALDSGRPVTVRTELKRSKSPVGEDGRITRSRSHTQTSDEHGDTPARRDTYASRRIKVSKYFTNSLIFLFVVLTAFLVIWGIKGAPPLEDLW